MPLNIRLLNILFTLFLSSIINLAQANSSVFISNEQLISSERIKLHNNWKFSPGDNFNWKEEDYNDSSWISVDSRLFQNDLSKINWEGIGWFRLHIDVDSLLLNKPLGISFYQTGTAEIYLNGNKLFETGRISENSIDSSSILEYPLAIVFNRSLNNVISIRYSNKDLSAENEAGLIAGFSLEIGDLSKMINATSQYLSSTLLNKTVFIVIPLILAIIHFFLFVFDPKLKQDLYYTLFLIIFAIYIFFSFSINYTLAIEKILIYRELAVLGLNFTLLLGSATIYSLYKPLPKYFYLLILTALLIGFFAFIEFSNIVWYLSYIFIIGVSIWGSIPLFDKKYERKGDNIVKVGFIIMSMGGFYQILLSFNLLPAILGSYDIFIIGVLAFMIFMSVSLAYEFALANRKLEKQLVEINELSEKTLEQELERKDLETKKKILEIENDRKSKELEDARKLQISMLPKEIPNTEDYDIAVFMKTATEVGGDYYDFNLTNDGTLNVVVGDATGHGMKAGLMVTTIKSLFTSVGRNLILTDFFEKCTVTIKEMNLGNLFMSLAFLKLKNEKILFASAGMPPIYHYRSGDGKLEQIINKSMPLGAVKNFQYEMNSLDFNSNDIVVIMSDGLPERFNKERKMLGQEKIAEKLKIISTTHSAEEIVDELYNLSEEWSDGRILDDDLTLVVIKKNDLL